MFSYDELGRLEKETRTDGAGNPVREWEYALDIVNNRLTASKSDGTGSDAVAFSVEPDSHNRHGGIGRTASVRDAHDPIQLKSYKAASPEECMGGFEEEGIWWEGTRGEYKMWIAYKRERALNFVKRGFSVGWYPDGSNWMDVFVPVRPHAGKAGYVASVMFFGKPSEYGIDGGAISKLTIRRHEESLESLLFGAHADTVFNYDRGFDIDLLETHPTAQELYDVVIRELNRPD